MPVSSCAEKKNNLSFFRVIMTKNNTSTDTPAIYTYFTSGYRKFGPALPHNAIYQKLKPLRTGIESTFGIVKENRYRMEQTNFYRGIDNVAIHAVEHDIVITQDIIFDYLRTGKKIPVLKLNY